MGILNAYFRTISVLDMDSHGAMVSVSIEMPLHFNHFIPNQRPKIIKIYPLRYQIIL